MKRLLLLAALCAFAAAMVPRERRAVNTDEEPAPAPTSTSTTKPICAVHTPCGWAFYKQFTRIIDSHVRNTYCQCSATTACEIDEDDTASMSYIKKCKPPSKDGETTPES